MNNLPQLTENEKDAVDHPGSRTFLFYFCVSFLGIFLGVLLDDKPLGLVIGIGLVCVVVVALFIMSLYLWAKHKETPFYAKGFKTHLVIIWMMSIFLAPFLGAININSTEEPIVGVPFNLLGAICFGYFIVALLTTIFTVMIGGAISDRRKQKNKEDKKE